VKTAIHLPLRTIRLLVGVLCLLVAEPVRAGPPIEIHFSPDGGCTEAIVKELAAAKTSVLVQAYWFTSAPIAKALVAAHQRGVRVEVILDKSRTDKDHTQADFLADKGVPTLIDDKHVTAHNKIILVDGQVALTGSFNFTGQAENQNAENLLVIRDKDVADRFTANWKAHAAHSPPYVRR
jgi:phosphatidylserine/phosphatidylglycerophosphate/cardiolipin synthase-like enzyme